MLKNILIWLVIGAIALFVIGLLGGLLSSYGWTRPAGFSPSGYYGYGCAGDWGTGWMMSSWGLFPFGFLSMLLIGLIPLSILALIVAGIFWVVRSLANRPAQS